MRLGIVCLLLLLCGGCQKYEWDNADSKEQASVVFPIGHGHGTQQRPLTVADVWAGNVAEGQSCWVMGYAVGSTNRTMSNALFSVPTEWAQNILLSDDSLCTDVADCIAVQFSTQKMKDAFSLVSHPDMHTQPVVLHGTIGIYLNQPGVCRASEGYWLPGFDLGQANVPPTLWDEIETQY